MWKSAYVGVYQLLNYQRYYFEIVLCVFVRHSIATDAGSDYKACNTKKNTLAIKFLI